MKMYGSIMDASKKVMKEYGFSLIIPSGTAVQNARTTFIGDNMGDHKVKVSFDVKNTGKMAASEIAQLYVHPTHSPVPRPQKELKGYEKVFLKKGETKRITIVLAEDAFSYYDMAA